MSNIVCEDYIRNEIIFSSSFFSWNLFVTPTLIKDHGKAESGGFTGFNPGTRAPGEGPG